MAAFTKNNSLDNAYAGDIMLNHVMEVKIKKNLTGQLWDNQDNLDNYITSWKNISLPLTILYNVFIVIAMPFDSSNS